MMLVFTQAYCVTGLIWTLFHSKEIVGMAQKTSMPAFFVSLGAIANTLFWPVALIWYNIKSISVEEA